MVKKIKRSTAIQATKQKVWEILLQDEYYRAWTAVFHPGSFAETDWKEGSKVRFNTPEGMGLVSNIRVHKPNDTITFEHIGLLKENQEYYDTEEVQKWKGFTETYTVTGNGNQTTLHIEQDMVPDYYDHFCATWEKALEKVKTLAEGSA